MNLQNAVKYPTKVLKVAKNFIGEHSPAILTGFGVAGVVVTTVMAVKATPRAQQLIFEARKDKMGDEKLDEVVIDDIVGDSTIDLPNLTVLETIRVAGPTYVPTALMGAATIGCILGANSVNARRNAALASLYSLSEQTLRDYKAKTKELVGEKKEQKIADEAIGEQLNRVPWDDGKVINTGKGTTLFFDPYSGRYFYNDYQVLRAAQNDVNALVIGDYCASLNDFYDRIGLDTTIAGEEVGWNMQNMCELTFTAKLTSKGEPCAVIGFQKGPGYSYRDL